VREGNKEKMGEGGGRKGSTDYFSEKSEAGKEEGKAF